MGRASRLKNVFVFIRHLLEGKRDETQNHSFWHLDSLEKVLSMWPQLPPKSPADDLKKLSKNGTQVGAVSDAAFLHLRRLYRYGFRLSVTNGDMRLRQFFADGELYRPEGYARESTELIADLAHLANEKNALKVGQCRVARAKPVLRALGFPDLDSAESFAVQFAGLGGERWIFIDSRPEVFRRETAAAIAAKLAEVDTLMDARISYQAEPRPDSRSRRDRDDGPAV